MKQLPTYIDRYPAKMVNSLANRIINDEVSEFSTILDPFCGSGAILKAAQAKTNNLIGTDINPYAILLTHVKLVGFNYVEGKKKLNNILFHSKHETKKLETNLINIDYWFTPVTLSKLLKLRYHLKQTINTANNEDLSILLAFALSIRLVSKADQKSPKPFISKLSISNRGNKHYDPYNVIIKIYDKLGALYPQHTKANIYLTCGDTRMLNTLVPSVTQVSHIITSPPYINAQDYFRNFKLELFLLEEILNFKTIHIKNQFIGSELGKTSSVISNIKNDTIKLIFNEIHKTNPRKAFILSKYFLDMDNFLFNAYNCLQDQGKLVLICGENIISNNYVDTASLLNEIATSKGFKVVSKYSDPIKNRLLAPTRKGHSSFIKNEYITTLIKSN